MSIDIPKYLVALGVSAPSAATIAFDPGYDHRSVQAYLEQGAHLLCGFKLSMGTWQIAHEEAVHKKISAIHQAGLPAIAGGSSFEIACAFDMISSYLEVCRRTGFDWIEVGEGFAGCTVKPEEIIPLAAKFGLEVQFELGAKFEGKFRKETLGDLCGRAREWIAAGARQIVIEAREDAIDVGLFDSSGRLDTKIADTLVQAVGGDLKRIQFEAPTKMSQFALIEYFGNEVVLANVRLEEILRVEIFRRGLHSRSFLLPSLRPRGGAS